MTTRLTLSRRAKLLEALLAPGLVGENPSTRRLVPDLWAGPEPVPEGRFVSSIHPEANRVWVTFKEPAKVEKPWVPFRWEDLDD